MAYLILLFAIVGEVFASSMLKLSDGFTKKLPVLGLVIGYLIAFWGLAMSLETIPLGIAYAIWSGLGTVITVMIGIVAFKERINNKKIVGALLIVVGIVLLNIAE